MSNDISDFTPFGARSRQELQVGFIYLFLLIDNLHISRFFSYFENFQIFTEFFSNKGTPKTVYAFVTSKNGKSLLDVKHLNATVQV